MIVLFALLVVIPGFRASFDLDVPRPVVVMAIIGIIATAGALMEIGWRLSFWRRLPRDTAVTDARTARTDD